MGLLLFGSEAARCDNMVNGGESLSGHGSM